MIMKISDATCISEICWKQLPAAEQRKGEGRAGMASLSQDMKKEQGVIQG